MQNLLKYKKHYIMVWFALFLHWENSAHSSDLFVSVGYFAKSADRSQCQQVAQNRMAAEMQSMMRVLHFISWPPEMDTTSEFRLTVFALPDEFEFIRGYMNDKSIKGKRVEIRNSNENDFRTHVLYVANAEVVPLFTDVAPKFNATAVVFASDCIPYFKVADIVLSEHSMVPPRVEIQKLRERQLIVNHQIIRFLGSKQN